MVKQKDRQIVGNMVSGIVKMTVATAVFLLVTPYIRAHLGNQANGLWWVIGAFAAYLSLVHASMAAGMMKYVAEYRARGQDEQLEQLINSGLLLCCLLGGVALAAGGLIYHFSGAIAALRNNVHAAEVRRALAVLILGVVLEVPFAGVRAVVAGLRRYDFVNLSAIAKSLVTAGGIVWLLRQGHGLVAMAWWTLSASLAANIATYVFLRAIQRFHLAWHLCRVAHMKELLRFGSFSLISAAANTLVNETQSIIIAALISAQAVTFYGVASRLVRQLSRLSMSAVSVLMPVASEISVLEGEQRRRKLEELLVRASRFSVILTLPGVLFLLVWGREFIAVWQGPSYAAHSVRLTYWVFVILVTPRIVVFSQHIVGHMLLGLAAHRFPAYLGLVVAGLSVGLGIGLARPYGVIGVALGVMAAAVVRRVVMQFYFKKVFAISLRRYYWQVWRVLAPMGVAFAGALILERHLWTISRLGPFLLVGVAHVGLFWLVSYGALDTYERKVLQQMLRDALVKLRQG